MLFLFSNKVEKKKKKGFAVSLDDERNYILYLNRQICRRV